MNPSALHSQLRGHLLSLSFHAFEQCLSQLLQAMGYEEVTVLGRTKTKQFTTHGGRDMEASARTGVTTTRIVLQAKQYERVVSRRFVDELRGTVLRLGAKQGLLITTSTFSQIAHKAAQTSIAPIVLVDGSALCRLLIQHRIGVTVRRRKGKLYLKSDTAYFDTLNAQFPPEPKNPTPYPKGSAPHENSAVGELSPPSDSRRFPCCPLTSSFLPMLWRTHLFAGLSTLWLYRIVPGTLTAENVLLLGTLAGLGALLPDLDAAESKIRSLSFGGIRPFTLIGAVVHKAWGHRGVLHSLRGLLWLGAILAPLGLWVGFVPMLALWGGYASHLLLDACTPSGIPVKDRAGRRFHLLPKRWRIVTGSPEEEMVMTLFLMTTLVLALSLMQEMPT